MSTGRYLAFCSGFDYWSNPLKLQRQVDFLECNSEYSLVYTNHRILVQSSLSFRDPNTKTPSPDESECGLLIRGKLNCCPSSVCLG
ncbi:MAG: hypothetical protein WCU80_11675 [Paludibacteraceae bacterium]